MTVSRQVSPLHRELRRLLDEVRRRTLQLIAPLDQAELRAQHDSLMSPIIWDLGHIAHFEELWLTQNLDGPIRFVEMPGMFNPNEHPRATRDQLDLPSLERCRELMQEIRGRVSRRLESADLRSGPELARDGFVYYLVAQHEVQHNETILQTLQLKKGKAYSPVTRRLAPPASLALEPGNMVEFAGGEVAVGTDDRTVAYDNERPRHTVELAPFAIDVAPVTNGQFLEFMADDGYHDQRLWSDEGWEFIQTEGISAPKYWHQEDGVWHRRAMDRDAPVSLDHPVCHVCYHEAAAFARWAGKRLPTEHEWEAAASWNPATGSQQLFPWGDEPATAERANIDQLTFDTAPIGAYPDNVSPLGCYGMIGDVWEWTASDFTGYPGFEAWPYPEYSQDFFGSEYQVLRGGSWATRPIAIRATFRNWDFPIRRQIFAGFRCARDG